MSRRHSSPNASAPDDRPSGVSVDLFERYRDALRRGHVAAARGLLEEAATAYREAIALAPDRPVAHTGLGAVHLRTGDLRAALGEFDLALVRSPRDEAGLAGRADALGGLGRRVDAAETFDRLAAVLEAADRLPDALAAAQRALALAEGKGRRRHVERLMQRLAPPPVSAAPPDSVVTGDGERDAPVAGQGDDDADGGVSAEEAAARVLASTPVDVRAVELERTPVEPEIDGVERLGDAEDALDRGDRDVALHEAIVAAQAFQRQGLLSAAIDASYLALAIAPDNAPLHLVLVSLYLERGWRGRAAEKLLLLGRLAELDADAETRDRLCAVVAAEFPGNPQLAALCA